MAMGPDGAVRMNSGMDILKKCDRMTVLRLVEDI